MQSDRPKPVRFLLFISALSLAVIVSAAYVWQSVLPHTLQATPAQLIVPPAQRRLKDPLPTLKPMPDLPPPASGPITRYQVQTLPADFEASDLSDTGIVVGSKTVSYGPSLAEMKIAAMFWQKGKMTRLPDDREMRCYAEAVNASGAIVGNIGGWSESPGGDSGSDAALWQVSSPRRKARRLRPISVVAHPGVRMTRINRWGQCIGAAGPGCSMDLTDLTVKSQEYDGFGDGTSQLSFFQNGTQTCIIGSDGLNDLNDQGQVVGCNYVGQFDVRPENADWHPKSSFGQFCQRAMLYEGACATVLWQDAKAANASAINNRGEVVGIKGNSPVLWSGGVLTHLPALSATMGGYPQDINDRSQVVGHCGPEGHQQAVLWHRKQVWDLSDLLVSSKRIVLTNALRINALGQILARDRKQRWYLLTPTTAKV